MQNKNLYIDIHVLQSVPAANINRDDAGSPKTVYYGGTLRSRVSSQSWKNAMRADFNLNPLSDNLGIRSKKVLARLAKLLVDQKADMSLEDAQKMAEKALDTIGVKKSTDTLLFISQWQLNNLVKLILSEEGLEQFDKKELKKAFMENNSLDLALFGRMVATNPELNVEGASQVAHAFSTHEIVPEFDFYTGRDDLQEENNAGAGMMGTIEYNSSTLYRYANVNVRELSENLQGEQLTESIEKFVQSFILSMPTGKQNSYANKTLPNYVLVTIRDDTPVNLASAFEEPVKSKSGYLTQSIKKLEQEFTETEAFVDKPVKTLVLTTKESSISQRTNSLNELLNQVAQTIVEVGSYEDSNN